MSTPPAARFPTSASCQGENTRGHEAARRQECVEKSRSSRADEGDCDGKKICDDISSPLATFNIHSVLNREEELKNKSYVDVAIPEFLPPGGRNGKAVNDVLARLTAEMEQMHEVTPNHSYTSSPAEGVSAHSEHDGFFLQIPQSTSPSSPPALTEFADVCRSQGVVGTIHPAVVQLDEDSVCSSKDNLPYSFRSEDPPEFLSGVPPNLSPTIARPKALTGRWNADDHEGIGTILSQPTQNAMLSTISIQDTSAMDLDSPCHNSMELIREKTSRNMLDSPRESFLGDDRKCAYLLSPFVSIRDDLQCHGGDVDVEIADANFPEERAGMERERPFSAPTPGARSINLSRWRNRIGCSCFIDCDCDEAEKVPPFIPNY